MKKIIVIITIIFAFITVSSILMAHKTGADDAYCGDPASGKKDCTECHNDNVSTFEEGMITSDIPESGYIGGAIYSITAKVSYSGLSKFGFEISPQDEKGNLLGEMIIGGSEMQLVPGKNGKYITHTITGNSGNDSKSWTFSWKAPVAGTGNVTFYGAFNAANGDNTEEGDNIFISTLLRKDASITDSLSVSVTKSDGCYGSNNGSITVTPSGGDAPYYYSWSPSGGNAATASGLAPDTYTCTITDSHKPKANIIIKKIAIINPPALNATINSYTNVKCRGEYTGAAIATASGGTGNLSYSWSPAGGNSSNATGLSAGLYSVLITDENKCTKTAKITITEPNDYLTLDPIAFGNKAAANASGGTPPYTYLWTPGGGINDTATGLANGTYIIKVTDFNGCTSSKSIVVNTGFVKNNNLSSLIKAYPNPVNGSLFIEVNTHSGRIYTLKIVDILGRVYYSQSLQLKRGNNILSFDLKDIKTGLYFLQIDLDGGNASTPIYK